MKIKKKEKKEKIKEKIHAELLVYLKNLLNHKKVTLKVLTNQIYNFAKKKRGILVFSKKDFVSLISGFEFNIYEPVLKTIFNLIFHDRGDTHAQDYRFKEKRLIIKRLSQIYSAEQPEGDKYLTFLSIPEPEASRLTVSETASSPQKAANQKNNANSDQHIRNMNAIREELEKLEKKKKDDTNNALRDKYNKTIEKNIKIIKEKEEEIQYLNLKIQYNRVFENKNKENEIKRKKIKELSEEIKELSEEIKKLTEEIKKLTGKNS